MTALFFMRAAALSGALAVALGAFGAHGLKPHLDEYQMDIWEKAVLYQFVHTLAVLALALFMQHQESAAYLRWSAWLMLLGMLLFSGSLYLLAVRNLLPFSVWWAGPVTPVGGLCFIAGWVLLLFKF
jgi:uncharacterized membrane protein YgdD (TMEM256/DUF423 family)